MINEININEIKEIDCIEYMNTLSDKCIDLIIVDPPYFRIVEEKWDKFKTLKDYLEWSNNYLSLCVDKLRLSGTLLLYGCSRNFAILCELNRMLINKGMYFVEEIIIDKGLNLPTLRFA